MQRQPLIGRPCAVLLAATVATAALLLSLLGAVEGFRTPATSLSSMTRRARGRLNMEANSAVSNAPLGQGPYKGPAASPLLDSVRYPHDMKQFSLKVCTAGVRGWFGRGSGRVHCDGTPQDRATVASHPMPTIPNNRSSGSWRRSCGGTRSATCPRRGATWAPRWA